MKYICNWLDTFLNDQWHNKQLNQLVYSIFFSFLHVVNHRHPLRLTCGTYRNEHILYLLLKSHLFNGGEEMIRRMQANSLSFIYLIVIEMHSL